MSYTTSNSSEETFQFVEKEDSTFTQVIKNAMLDNKKDGTTNKGYFTKDDFIYNLIMVPNERWTENEAEQTFYPLLQEGKIRRRE